MKMLVAMMVLVMIAAPLAASDAFTYDDYAAVLDTAVVDGGLVDYDALAKSPAHLDAFAGALSDLPREIYATWDASARIAFWINAYNALTLKLIVDYYPLDDVINSDYPERSIRQIPGAWDEITFSVMGQEMTLDHIENDILRKAFVEPRIHMALVCAARSCPPLRAEPFRGPQLDRQLDDQTRRFLASPRALVIDRESGLVWVSAIFDWFAGDFVEQYSGEGGGGERAVIEFVAPYVSPDDRRYLESNAFELRYLDYDWTLNGREP